MKRLSLLSALVPLLMASCSTDDTQEVIPTPSGARAVEFTLGGISTKVANNEFEADDYISVQALEEDGTEFKHAVYKYANSKFASEDPITIAGADAGVTKYEYKALYPKVETFASEFDFTIPTDQSVKGSFSLSDLLVAKVAATESLTPELKFEHTMSNVIIDVEITDNGNPVTKTISNFKVNALNVAACDIDNDTFDGKGTATEITPAGSGSSYNVIIAPQELTINGDFASLEVEGQTIIMENPAAQTFESGKRYTIKWTIDLTTPAQSIELTTTIGKWEDGYWTSDPTQIPTPAITTFAPTSLSFTDTETAAKDVVVTVTDLGTATISAESSSDHFTTSVSGTTVSVTPTKANTTDADITSTVSVSVSGGNTMTFEVTHSAPAGGGDSGETPTYPVTIDFTSFGLSVGNNVLTEAGTPFKVVDNCSVEFVGINQNNSFLYAGVPSADPIVYGITVASSATMTITSTSPISKIHIYLYQNNNGDINTNKTILNVESGTIDNVLTGDKHLTWTKADDDTKSITISFRGVATLNKLVIE